MSSAEFTDAERLMSAKAAILGGICAGSVSLGILIIHRVLNPAMGLPLLGEIGSLAMLTLLVNGAIASIAGAMFALTYRYAVRQDNNVQLNTGVVLAFTLVRGLAQVDAGSAIAQTFWPFLSACGESVVIFGLTALCLTFATQRQWLTPFGQS